MEKTTRPQKERMLRIHQIINEAKDGSSRFRNAYPNANDISQELEVSAKTIQRDIEFMRSRLNLPIEYDQIKHGFYYTEEVASFPTIQITEGELFSLLIAQKAIASYQGTTFEGPLKQAFRKLADSLPESINIHLDDWDRSIAFHSASVPVVDLKQFNLLSQAVMKKEQLLIKYKKPNQKEASERQIDPIQIVHVSGEWYLLAWCYKRKKFITFLIQRIRSIKKTGRKCARHGDFSVEDHLRNSFGIYSGDQAFQITLKVDKSVADYFRERKWHSSQINKELSGGHLRVHYVLNSLEEIQRWILGWGGMVQALAPKQLVDSIHNAAQNLLKKH